MELSEIIFVIAGCFASFAAGVLVHKYVISEAQSVKNHVTNEVTKLRGEISSTLKSFVKEL